MSTIIMADIEPIKHKIEESMNLTQYNQTIWNLINTEKSTISWPSSSSFPSSQLIETKVLNRSPYNSFECLHLFIQSF